MGVGRCTEVDWPRPLRVRFRAPVDGAAGSVSVADYNRDIMGKVCVLPEILAHQIAAGEIVERPASVVKELVENSLDAGARRIEVEVQQGGKRSMLVRDDGTGMSPEDAETAFQHHATSKISSFEDLSAIRTLGFRGEALPSIAAVARLQLRTVEREAAQGAAPLGTEIRIEGGQLRSRQEISWPAGTEIVVADLFFNVPARRKFLKSVPTESGHISRQVTHYALAYPEVAFQLDHQGRSLIEAPAVHSLEDRVYQILGGSFLENLVPVDYRQEGVRVHGFTSLPHEQRSSARYLYLFVNRRVVRDKVIAHAIRQAYQDLIPASAHPVALLFLEVDPLEVDVNVHPCKTEIRFQNADQVHRAIFHAVEEALLLRRTTLGSLARDLPAGRLELRGGAEQAGEGVARSIEKFFQRNPDSSLGFPQLRRPPSEAFDRGQAAPPAPSPGEDPHASNIPETAYLSPVPVVLGQFVESFLVAADREGVMLIDQHVAHERILYDRALRELASADGTLIQRLLIPQTLELTPAQKAVMEEILEQLNQNGFEVEWFGERTVAVKGVPQLASRSGAIPQMLQDILDGYPPQGSNGTALGRLREKIAISLSCRAAIKINTPLSSEKMQWLIDELFRCENPYTCPHGRPIVLRLNIEEVLRGFKRI